MSVEKITLHMFYHDEPRLADEASFVSFCYRSFELCELAVMDECMNE